ncbi:30S ribosomal protein S1 [Rickettsiales bacterium]|nr:30S ribosomal protein S1 [Rickettsiales bacterium]
MFKSHHKMNQEIQENFIIEENFAELFNDYKKDSQKLDEGNVVKAVIIEITDKNIVVDVGAKSIGYIAKNEFKDTYEEGDVIDVYLEKIEDRRGELIVSYQKGQRLKNWEQLQQCLENGTEFEGEIIGRVKGGYAVDVGYITVFLPKSQVDVIMPTEDDFLINQTHKLKVLKIDEIRGNIVVSRRSVIEGKRQKAREEVLSKIKVSDVLDGIVKNITDYGAFIDFGDFDGLLHLTDISWHKVRHPSEFLTIGQEVKVKVIKCDEKNKRISLGMKQLQQNPWDSLEERFPVGRIVKGTVTNVTNYGAFVEIENGIEGLVHVSEISWTKTPNNANRDLVPNQEIDVMILDINSKNHRISLGIKQCIKNPWEDFSDKHVVGDIVEGEVRNYTNFGLFVGLEGDVDGLIYMSDLANGDKPEEKLQDYKEGDKIKVVVLGSSPEKQKIALGIKQLENKNFKKELLEIKEGAIVSSIVLAVKKDLIEIETDIGLKGIIKRLELGKNKNTQKTENFMVGDRIDAKVTLFDPKTGKLSLSIREMESDQENNYVYSSENSGESIGNIVGDLFDNNEDKKES